MSFQTPITISSIIEDIEGNRFLLPAIQREFVWSNGKIEWLFDSLMQKYPISSFLFWSVQGDTKTKFKFYSILREFREKYKTHNDLFDTTGSNDFSAVLDGQQRLTAIYIGLKGSYAYKLPRVWWEDSEKNIPTRKLYLNIKSPLASQEDGRIYNFQFLTEGEYKANQADWFKVGKILDLKGLFEFNNFLDANNYKSNKFTYESLSRLHEAIHSERAVNYFLEREQNIDKALHIFIRINSGGEPLDYSDLIMSIAVANWSTKDAREEIFELVDEIRDKGFFISKDFVLKTFLVLHSKDIKFKVNNFSADNAKDFESRWDLIRSAIVEAFTLIKGFGYVDSTLTSKNAIIPIIYYIYHRNIVDNFHSKIQHDADRKLIARWLHIVLIKRLFGAHADNILTAIRSVFTSDFGAQFIETRHQIFPLDEVAKKLKGTDKNMTFDDAYIDYLLLTQKDDKYAFSILALLYDYLDYKNETFHKDHIHPYSCFSLKYLKDKGIADSDYFFRNANNYNSILNLQMLDGNENKSKQDKTLSEWTALEIVRTKTAQPTFLQKHMIPDNIDLKDFKVFIAERRKILKQKLLTII